MRACAGASQNEGEFVARLREQGLQVRPRYAAGGNSQVTGYSVRLPRDEHDQARAVWYGGGTPRARLTLPALRRSLASRPHRRRTCGGQLAFGRAGAGAACHRPPGRCPPGAAAAERARVRCEVEQRGLLWHRCTACRSSAEPRGSRRTGGVVYGARARPARCAGQSQPRACAVSRAAGPQRYNWIVWITGIGVIIAFIAVCETALFFARRHPQFVAKLYMLEDWSSLTGRRATRTPDLTLRSCATTTNSSRHSKVRLRT